jgi:serine/threonine protein kinase
LQTPTWLAPEVLSEQPYTVKSDVYAMGIIMWELLTFQHPFEEFHFSFAYLIEEAIKVDASFLAYAELIFPRTGSGLQFQKTAIQSTGISCRSAGTPRLPVVPLSRTSPRLADAFIRLHLDIYNMQYHADFQTMIGARSEASQRLQKLMGTSSPHIQHALRPVPEPPRVSPRKGLWIDCKASLALV